MKLADWRVWGGTKVRGGRALSSADGDIQQLDVASIKRRARRIGCRQRSGNPDAYQGNGQRPGSEQGYTTMAS